MVLSMGISNNYNFLSNTNNSDDSLEKIKNKYKNHPSITCTDKLMTNSELTFTFQPVTKNQISKLIKLLNDEIAVQSTDIPAKLTKGLFAADFKKTKVCPHYKSNGRADKANYLPNSILLLNTLTFH